MANIDLGKAFNAVPVGGWRAFLSRTGRFLGGLKMVEVVKKYPWGAFAVLGTLWMLSNMLAAFGGYSATKITPDPYGQVDIISAEYDDRGDGTFFYFVANFVKYQCDIENLRVAVKYPSVGVASLPWEDVDGREDDEKVGLDNRLAGEQTLRIRFNLAPDFEWVEIRTTHLCPRRGAEDAVRVPKVFARMTGDG